MPHHTPTTYYTNYDLRVPLLVCQITLFRLFILITHLQITKAADVNVFNDFAGMQRLRS